MGRKHKQIGLTLVLVMLLATASACSLATSSGDKPPVNEALTTPTITSIVPATFALKTATPLPTPFPTQGTLTATPIPCTPYTSWPIYTIQANDTLSAIAGMTGTTVEQLVIANCLFNSDMIYVGQLLYVPVYPPTATPLPTLTPFATVDPQAPKLTQMLTARQHWIDSSGRAVTYLPAIRVDLGEAYNTDRVDFYVDAAGDDPAIFIGTDLDPWDGAFVDYDFPAPGSYTFQAFAENEYKQISTNVFTMIYDPTFVPPEGRRNVLAIAPYVTFNGTEYLLTVGETVTITWASAPVGANQVEFRLSGMSTFPEPIGVDRNLLDGSASTVWAVPTNLYGRVQGFAQMPDGSIIESQDMIVRGQ